MHRWMAVAAVLFSVSASCSGGGSQRVVRVDFQQDEFASFYWRYFPGAIEAHPSDTVVFDQQWTGEPHTVTMGSLVDRALPRAAALEAKYSAPMVINGKRYANFDEYIGSLAPDQAQEAMQRATRESNRVMGGVPTFDPYAGGLAAQNAALPCYLTNGVPPSDPNTACERHSQPNFNGRQSYYSSGFIPPAGPTGNKYRVKLSPDIRPATYRFFCLIHFPWMQGQIVVKPKGSALLSQKEVNQKAQTEIEKLAAPLRTAYAQAKVGRAQTGDARIPLPMGGYHSEREYTVAILEFVPRIITTTVGKPVTWTITGAHTLSFGVPRYVPIYFVSKDGTVRRNPVVDRPAGGSPTPPPVDFTKGPYHVDGGTYGGSGFFSSGWLGSEPFSTYTLRFGKPGSYRFACLIHPRMVGTVVVRG